MAQFVLEDFRRGVDLRRAPFAAPSGALSKGVNVHLTSGGDVEARKAFVPIATLPAGCFGIAALRGSLYSFGSVAAPSMPAGFTYQQLPHPTAAAMTGVVDIEPFDGKAFVIAKYGDDVRTFYDGTRIKDLDTDVCRFRFSVTAGTADAANKISAITVGGVEILGADVLWTTSHANTAALLAAQINTYSSTPNYTAYLANGMAEVVIASPAGTISTGDAVAITVAGDVTVSAATGSMAAPPAAPTSARTAGEKVYVTSGPNLLFTAVADPTNFSENSAGGGFINISTQSSGSETLTGSELFYEDLIVFAKDSAQRWHIEADDTQNKRVQTFRGVGLVGARAALSYLDGPTFFLSRQGSRAVQTRDLTGRGLARSDSKAIDKDLVAFLRALAPSQQARALMLTEPEDDRLWVCVGSRIYVRTWFVGDTSPSWSTYEPGFTVDDYAILDDRLYLLSGSDVYLYGGTTGDEYEVMTAIVRLPYANLRAPATLKGLYGLDLGIEGEWTVAMSQDPDDLDFTLATDLGTYSRQTFDLPNVPLAAQTAYVSLELRHTKAEYARLSSIVFHYKTDTSG